MSEVNYKELIDKQNQLIESLTQSIDKLEKEINLLKEGIKANKIKEFKKENNIPLNVSIETENIKNLDRINEFDIVKPPQIGKCSCKNLEINKNYIKHSKGRFSQSHSMIHFDAFKDNSDENSFELKRQIITIGKRTVHQTPQDLAKYSDKISVCFPHSFIRYFEVTINGNKPIVSVGLINNAELPSNQMVGWAERTIGLHTDDGKIYEAGHGTDKIEIQNGLVTIGCGYNFFTKTVFFTLNGEFKFGEDYLENNIYPAIGFLECNDIFDNFRDKVPFLFDLPKFISKSCFKDWRIDDYNGDDTFLTFDIYVENSLFDRYVEPLLEIKEDEIDQIDERNNISYNNCNGTKFVCYKNIPDCSIRYQLKTSFDNFKLSNSDIKGHDCGNLYGVVGNNIFLNIEERELEYDIERTNKRIYIHKYVKPVEPDIPDIPIEMSFGPDVKPVILFYNDKNEKEDIEIKLTLRNELEIGATYPNPLLIEDNNEYKKYLWKCQVNYENNESKVIVNDKSYSYIFWEGKNISANLKGDKVILNPNNVENDLDELLKLQGLNERERNDFIVYWIRVLNKMKTIEVTICDDSYEKVAPLEITNYPKQLRVFLLFKESNENYSEDKSIKILKRRERPTGKYIVEWGGEMPI